MKIEIAALRLLAGAVLALGFTAGGAPASAQDAGQEIPWYMPQPWVHPPQTGPKIRKLPGYYGHSYRNRSYGGFGNSCYGSCRSLPGTVSTGYGVTLSEPVVAVFDPREYQVVPRTQYQSLEAAVSRAAATPARPAVVPVGIATKRSERMPQFSMQNGVRIIRPAPLETN